MKNRTVAFTAENRLCTSCGVCAAACPKACIAFHMEGGMYVPQIDEGRCVQCGICAKVCPGLGFSFGDQAISALDAARGSWLAAYNAWSKDPTLRHVSASGGVVSALITAMLTQKRYDVAFCVDTYDYSKQLCIVPVQAADVQGGLEKSSVPKSRYLPVSHEKVIAYIKANQEKRVICVGTPCALRGIQAVLKQLSFDREKCLMIGLFCDSVFGYHVYSHYQRAYCGQRALVGLHFKNKESGGWPGNMKLLFGDGSSMYLDKSYRTDAKAYFMPERCMYCIDKLNVSADISLGDNYTKSNSSPLGSNSVIIRTKRGKVAWEAAKDAIEAYPVDMKEIEQAQYLSSRMNHLHFAALKERELKRRTGEVVMLNGTVTRTEDERSYEQAWRARLLELRIGLKYGDQPDKFEKQKKQVRAFTGGKGILGFSRRVYYAVKRRIM